MFGETLYYTLINQNIITTTKTIITISIIDDIQSIKVRNILKTYNFLYKIIGNHYLLNSHDSIIGGLE